MAKPLFAQSSRSSAISTVIPRHAKTPALLAKALACHRAGRLAKATILYQRILLLEPDLAEVHNNLGHALKTLGRLDAAEESFRRAIALEPDNAQAHCGLGTVLLDLGRSIEAAVAFGQAIALKPDFAAAYNNLGLALKEAGQLAAAARVAERAIRLAPRKTSYYLNLAEVRSFTPGDPYLTTLEALAGEAASLPVDDRIHLHFALAKAYEDLGRHDSAFAQLVAGNGLKRGRLSYDEAASLARMDRVRELFTADLIGAQRDCGERSRVPVFIVGMPRSGTTLIEQILASHPAVSGAGEVKLLDRAAGMVRDKLPGTPAFPDMVSLMGGEHFRALGGLYLAELTRRAPGAARITDKMPSNFLFAGLIHLALPDATIVHAVRDPIDTCVSYFARQFVEGQEHTYDLAELGRHHRGYQAVMAHWHRVLPPGRILDVRYEDVVADLEGAARRLVAHCGLAWDARCLDFHRTERTVQTASAAQVRRPIYQTSVARWRRYERFLGPLLAALAVPSGAETS